MPALALSTGIAAAPRSAPGLDWTRVEEIPASSVYSLQLRDKTLFAGGTNIVYIGTGEGTSWTASTAVHPAAAGIETVAPAGLAMWAGTYGHGVYRSGDGGLSWDPVQSGLVGLGANYVVELVDREGVLYAATAGAGVFSLDLASPTAWSSFNVGLPVAVSGTVADLVFHGTTLAASAGGNGFVYRWPDGATSWEEAPVVPPILPGLVGTDLLDGGGDLYLGTGNGVYRSADDARTWVPASNGLRSGTEVVLAANLPVLYAGVDYLGDNHRIYRSADRGESWQEIDEILGSYLFALEVAGDRLFAARTDGLWWTPLVATGVEGATWTRIKDRFRGSR